VPSFYLPGVTLLLETAAVSAEWERLVTAYQVTGKNVHDAVWKATVKPFSGTCGTCREAAVLR
jgi:hypothetical protein